MPSTPETACELSPSPIFGWRRLLAGVLLLAAVTAIIQGGSVRTGMILDDFNHRAELCDGDWSFRSLVNASHLGDPRRRVQMWWQKDADLYFFRPVAFAFVRATYIIGGWRPEAVHVASLGWGVACSSLVLVLAWHTTGRFGWSLLAALLFLLHPNNAGTPQWVACQNEQMATAFTLLALLAYGRYAGWWRGLNLGFGKHVLSEPASVKPVSTGLTEPGSDKPSRSPRPDTHSPVWIALAVACYIAALGCRESAILMPAYFLVGDLAIRITSRRSFPRQRRAILGYAALAVVACAYLAVRHAMLGPVTIPGRPYAWPPTEPGFIEFVAEKFIYYILGLWAFVPIIGFAGQQQIRNHIEIFCSLFIAIMIGWALVLRLMRSQSPPILHSTFPTLHSSSTGWDAGHPTQPPSILHSTFPTLHSSSSPLIYLWLAVSLVPLIPVLPIFAASHHLYLASAGAAIATIMGLRAVLTWCSRQSTLVRRAVRATLIALMPLLGLVFVGANYATSQGIAGLASACQLTPAQVVRFGRPLRPHDRLFFINLPMLAFNCMPAIEEARQVAPLHGYVLTFAPKFIRMDRPAHVEQVGPHQLRVWLDEPAYFSGLIGQSILQGINRDRPFAAGETFATPDFDVRVERADARGVQEFLFTFPKPLTDPAYHFFQGSQVFDAYPITFK